MQEIVPFRSPIFEVFGDRTKILIMQCYLNSFSFDFTKWILRILNLIFLCLDFKPIAIFIFFILEKFIKNQILIFLEDSILAFNKGRKQSKIFCSQLSSSHSGCFIIETFDEIIYFFLTNSSLNSFWIILKNSNQALLNILPINIFRMLQE